MMIFLASSSITIRSGRSWLVVKGMVQFTLAAASFLLARQDTGVGGSCRGAPSLGVSWVCSGLGHGGGFRLSHHRPCSTSLPHWGEGGSVWPWRWTSSRWIGWDHLPSRSGRSTTTGWSKRRLCPDLFSLTDSGGTFVWKSPSVYSRLSILCCLPLAAGDGNLTCHRKQPSINLAIWTKKLLILKLKNFQFERNF